MTVTEMVAAERCPVCAGERFRTAFEEPPYRVLRCLQCGTGVVSPRAADLESIYAAASYWHSGSPRTLGYGDYRAAEPLYLKTFRRRLSFALPNAAARGKALDVGCAAGFCMQALRELGFDAYGVEVSETIATHAIERLGFDTIHIGTLESAPFAEYSFDLITMWDVIEHVADPGALLSRAKELLDSDGLLVLETQNIDSAFARVLGPRWHHYKHAEHIYHFTPASLRRLLESAGFTVKTMSPRYGGKYVSLDFIAERAGRIHPGLSKALTPLRRLQSVSLYVNVMDEIVATAAPGN